jgi:hypothetical protein
VIGHQRGRWRQHLMVLEDLGAGDAQQLLVLLFFQGKDLFFRHDEEQFDRAPTRPLEGSSVSSTTPTGRTISGPCSPWRPPTSAGQCRCSTWCGGAGCRRCSRSGCQNIQDGGKVRGIMHQTEEEDVERLSCGITSFEQLS